MSQADLTGLTDDGYVAYDDYGSQDEEPANLDGELEWYDPDDNWYDPEDLQ